MGLADPHGNIFIYIESLSHINVAIQRRSFAKQFHRDKIGETCLFALDESKRMFAVYSSARVGLSFRLSPSPSCKKSPTDTAPHLYVRFRVWVPARDGIRD